MQQFLERTEQLADKSEGLAKNVGNYMADGFQYLALFVIGATIVWSAASTYMDMIGKGVASVDDILLLFIFLELGTMVGIYFKTNRLPVQFLLYVAITVMTRSLASTLSIMDMTDQRLLAITGAILMLAIAVLVLRYALHKIPPFISHVEPDDTRRPAREYDPA
jgi:phosphate starvation-inducible membrane PsiE